MPWAGEFAGKAIHSDGVPIENGRWYHVAAVKQGNTLTLYLDGEQAAEATAPAEVRTLCDQVGIGYNPLFSGNEHFKGCIDDAAFYARALTAEEIQSAAK